MISDPTIAQALPDAWMRAIDESARTLLGPHDRVGDALATEVARLTWTSTRARSRGGSERPDATKRTMPI